MRSYWSEDEDNKLMELYKSNLSVEEVSKILNRSVSSIRLRASRYLNIYRSDKHIKEKFKSKNFYLSLKSKISSGTAGAKCCICGYDKHIDLHHIDGDRYNNMCENISSLCPNHHREVENSEHKDKKLYCIWWRVYSNNLKGKIQTNEFNAS